MYSCGGLLCTQLCTTERGLEPMTDNVIPIRRRRGKRSAGPELELGRRTCQGDVLQPTAPMPRLRLVRPTTPEGRPTDGS